MKIAMGSDHGGFALKQHLKTYLETKRRPVYILKEDNKK